MKHSSLLKLIILSALSVSVCACGGDGDEPLPAPAPAPGPSGGRQVFTTRWNPDRTFQSNILGRSVAYSVLVPQEYLSNPSATFPVVYLFHGYGDDQTSWGPGHFDIQQQDELARNAGQTGPVIYVMPQGWNSYYVNRYDGGFNYMDMIVKELVPMIDRMLPTQANARGRAVAGYSMGGFGALAMAGKNPGVFGTCISLSPSMNTDAQYRTLGGWDSQWGDIFGGRGTVGDARLTPAYLNLCPLHFFADNDASAFSGQTWFISTGDDEERLYAGSGELHSLLLDKGIPHEFRVDNGAHTTAYWRAALREGLAVFKAANEGTAYPIATPVNPTSGSTPRLTQLDAKQCPVALYVGNGCKHDGNTKIIYAELGGGGHGLTADELASQLSQALQIKNCALAVVLTANHAGATAEDIRMAVEQQLGVTATDANRVVLGIGNGLDLFGGSGSDGSQLHGFYLFDSDLNMAGGSGFKAAQYMLDITDMGVNHRQMFLNFCALRDADAKVEYRVHNGDDSAESARYGLANVVKILFNNLPVR